MKKMLASSLLFMFGCLAAAAEIEHEANVIGYQAGEFAVKGIIEQQLERVAARISSSRAKSDQVDFSVIGCADQTGISALNDELGRKRAEEVKAFLSGKFPDARIVARTKGAELDSKMVIVKWKFSSAHVLSPQNTPQPGVSYGQKVALWIMALLSLASLLWWPILVWARRTRKKASEESKPAEPVIVQPEVIDATSVTVEINGTSYSVPVVKKGDGMWYTPFRTLTDRPMFRADFKDAVGAVKSCVKKQDYGPAIEKLIADGTIKRRGQ